MTLSATLPVLTTLGIRIQQRMQTEQYVENAVNDLLTCVIDIGASDLIFEPDNNGDARIRARLHGRFYDIVTLQKKDADRCVSRLKVMADIPVYIQGKALEGRIDYALSDDALPVEFRMSSVPTIGGQRVVLRILDPAKNFRSLDKLGFDSEIYTALTDILIQEQGLFIVCGPTSSGKTTTLYALLHHITSNYGQTRQVIMIEDPVEFPVNGVPQIQVNEYTGFGFEEALKAVLRQDPEVIGLGEIRDGATARMAVRAAMTGHLVLGTVHAGCAEEVPGRLRDLGVDRRLLANSLTGILSQRLVTVACTCSDGCSRCLGTGISGRSPHAVFTPVTSRMREAILTRKDISNG